MENQSYCNIPNLRPLGQNIKRNKDSFSKGGPTLFMTVCMYYRNVWNVEYKKCKRMQAGTV